VRAGQALPLS